MALILAHRTNRPADLWVVYSRLQAGGFHPFIHNLEHGTIASAYLLALGGYDIWLPEEEISEAKIWMSQSHPTQDFDPIRERPIRAATYLAILTANPVCYLLLLPSLGLFTVWTAYVIFLLYIDPPLYLPFAWGPLFLLVIILIIAHAEFLTAKKNRETNVSNHTL